MLLHFNNYQETSPALWVILKEVFGTFVRLMTILIGMYIIEPKKVRHWVIPDLKGFPVRPL